MLDANFKQQAISFPANWLPHSNGNEISINRYKPDRSFKNEYSKIVCVIESSSTNDRKVGVGELCLADKFFFDNNTEGILIFSLCGRSTTPPRPDTQAHYLTPYFLHLQSLNRPYGVKRVYIISEKDFALSGWVALGPEFQKRAHVLKA